MSAFRNKHTITVTFEHIYMSKVLGIAETNRRNFLCSSDRKLKPQTDRKSDTDVHGDVY